MVDPIIAPYAQTYAQHTPYLSLDEYRLSPNAVDTSRLVVGGNQAAQDAALANVIMSASSWVDLLCRQVLAATPEVWAGYPPQIQPDGSLLIAVPFSPLVAVTGFQIGDDPSNLLAAQSLSGVAVNRKVVRIPASLVSARPQASGGGPAPYRYASAMPYVVLSYIAGFANGYLTAPAASGGTALTIDNTAGAFPGMTLTVNDPATQSYETVTVASVAGQTVNLAAPLAAAHAAKVNVSALPPVVKEATVLLVSGLIKKRGAYSIAIASPGQKPQLQQQFPSGTVEEQTATGLLADLIRRV